MWFTREQFEICDELRQWGLVPRFEPGDVVARGFADLGYEEFQVLPGPRLLSLTAGTASDLPAEHRDHFFWIPSVDEGIELLERQGCSAITCYREEGREWVFEIERDQRRDSFRGRGLHEVVLRTLLSVYRDTYKDQPG